MRKLSLSCRTAPSAGRVTDMDADDKDTRHDGEDLDDTEREIQSQAARGVGDVPSHDTPRRTSLDRSYTMPAPSWEEGDQILKEYRQRKAAREAARRSKGASEGGVWSAPLSQAQGSAPPSVQQGPDPARSPSRNTASSTQSLLKKKSRDIDGLPSSSSSPDIGFDIDFAASVPLPESATATGSSTSSHFIKLSSSARPNSFRRASTSASNAFGNAVPQSADDSAPNQFDRPSDIPQQRRPSLKRVTSDAPLSSRRFSSRKTSSDSQDGRGVSSRRTRSVKSIRLPSRQTHEDDVTLSPSRPSSIIDHGEEASDKQEDQDEAVTDTQSGTSLVDELREHAIPKYDDTAYGIPTAVVLNGERVDISEMGILEQVEMLRRAQKEAKEGKSRATMNTDRDGDDAEALDFYQNMPSTDLSVIVERTECATNSPRTTIAPTLRSESMRSQDSPFLRRTLQPYTPTRLSVSTMRSELSGLSGLSKNGAASPMTQAELIRYRYRRKNAASASENSKSANTGELEAKKSLESANTSKSGKSALSPTATSPPPAHRKYTSIGATNYHTLPLSPKSSMKSGPGVRASASAPSVPALSAQSKAGQSSSRFPGSVSVPNIFNLGESALSPVSGASQFASPKSASHLPSSGSSLPAGGQASPSKHIYSPSMTQKIEMFHRTPYPPDMPYNVSPIHRKRSKSMHSDDRSGASRVFGSSSKAVSGSSCTGLPPSKSTSALVQMFESRAAATQEDLRSSSPVKEWLKKVDPAARPFSSGALTPAPAPSVSSASGSMTDRDAFARRKAKQDIASFTSTTSAKSANNTGSFQQQRKRSQSLTALPEVLSNQEEDLPFFTPATPVTQSFEDFTVAHHGDLYWLNSSSTIKPPFWQNCRAVLTTGDQLRISWLGSTAGGTHERYFDLRTCTSAHSIRRTTDVKVTTVQAYDPVTGLVLPDQTNRLHVFELVWPGRVQRFACLTLNARVKWLGYIFEAISKYSNTGTPATETESAPEEEERTVDAGTVKSLDLPKPILQHAPSSASTIGQVPRRRLEKETQDSLYASVSDMLSGASKERKDNDLPDVPRYQLVDPPTPRNDGFKTPGGPTEVGLMPLRGAWSDVDRLSTASDPVAGAGSPPAAKNVARDLKRILSEMGKTRSAPGDNDAAEAFPNQLKEMQSHLERISHDIRRTSVVSRHSRHAPVMVEKMDELLALCKRMAEEKPKAPLFAQEIANAAVEAASEPESKHPGLKRLEEKVETLLEVVNRLAASESPTTRKASKSSDKAVEAAGPANPPASASAAQTKETAPAAPSAYHLATARAFDMLPSHASLMYAHGADFDKDLAQWQKYDKKRNSALPPLPPAAAPTVANQAKPRQSGVPDMQAAMADYYRNLSMKADQSTNSRPSSIVSSNRVRNARSDAAMRLDGSHPALSASARPQPLAPIPALKQQPVSKWSADTAPVESASRLASVKPPRAQTAVEPTTKINIESAEAHQAEGSGPPTQKEQDALLGKDRVVQTTDPAVQLQAERTQQAILTQLNSMQGLLQTLLAAQNKQSEALKHQEDVSAYIKHLQEYLADDKTNRKADFETIKSRLDGIQQQLSEVPKEVQTVVEASLAVAILQKPEAPHTRASTPSPPPAPDTDTPGQPTVRISDPEQVVASPALLAETAQANKGPASAPQSRGKKSGTSLLRKVSLGLAGMANMATAGGVHTGPRVGGPRKMGAGRLFGNLPPGATAPDAKDRWNPNRYKTGGPTALDQPKQDMPPPDVPEIQPNDQQAQLMEALEGFEKQTAEDTGENDEHTTVIALGILEVLKMLKEQEARDYQREHRRNEEAQLRMELERDRHAMEIENVRAELREWEAKREELAAASIKDPENQEGIDTIIALLKDQMAYQEKAMANLKDTLTPQIKGISDESEEAILAMREEMSKSLAEFRAQLDEEVKKTLDEVGTLRDQKKQLQSDLSDLLAFKSKYGGGAPEGVQQQRPAPPQQAHQGIPSHYIRPMARQAHPQPSHPPPRPDTSMSGTGYPYGLRGPR